MPLCHPWMPGTIEMTPDDDATRRDEKRPAFDEDAGAESRPGQDVAVSADDRPVPAEPPVLHVRDAEPAGIEPADAAPVQPIGSTLVGAGAGGLPAAGPRDDLGAPTGDRTDDRRDDAAGPARTGDDGFADGRLTDAEIAAAFGDDTAPATRSDRVHAHDGNDDWRTDSTAEPQPSAIPAVAPAPASTDPSPRARRSGGFGGLVLGGMIAAALGAGAAWWAVPRMPEAWQPVPPAPAVDTAAISAGLRAETQATLDAALANMRTDAAAAAIAAAQGELAAQAESIAARAAEAATAAADPAVRAALAELPAPGIGQDAMQSLSQAAAAAGADAARRIIAESPASDTPANLNATLSAQAQQIATLRQAVDTLRAAVPADLAARLDSQQAALDELAARPTLDADAAARLQQVADSVAETQAQLREATDTATAELARVRDEAARLQDAAADAARRAQTAAAAASLSSALNGAEPVDRGAAVAQLQEAGVDVPQALTADVVPLGQLQADFPDAARAALAASLAAGTTGGSALGNFLRAQTGARSVVPREGSDPDAVLSRADAAVARGDIAAALAEIAELPERGQAAMADWTARARAWVDASGAVAGLTTTTVPVTTAAPAASAGSSPAASAQPSN